jgi:hypothetical protein
MHATNPVPRGFEPTHVTTDDGERIPLVKLRREQRRHPHHPHILFVEEELRQTLHRQPTPHEIWLLFKERFPVAAQEMLQNTSLYLRVGGQRYQADILEDCVLGDELQQHGLSHPYESRQARWDHFAERFPERAHEALELYLTRSPISPKPLPETR